MSSRDRHRLLGLAVALGSVVALLGWPGPDVAGAQAETTARGTLRGEVGGSTQPLAGVTLTVTSDGEVVEVTETADDGSWQVTLPGGGTYVATIDVETLPQGVEVPEGREPTTEFEAREGRRNGVVLTLTSTAERDTVSRVERLATLFGQGLKFGLVIALAALGLSLVFGVTGLINFSHGELLTFGGLVAYYLNVDHGIPLIAAGVVSFLAGGALGFANERGLWAPLRARGTSRVALIVVSIGLSIVLRYLYLMVFGGASRGYVDFSTQRVVSIGPVSLPPKDYAIIAISAVVLLVVSSALARTRLGVATRAVADDRDLAEASGVDVRQVILVVWVTGAALAALSGVLYSLTESVRWNVGFELLLLTFAAVILGGIGTAYGAMVGGILIGVAIQVSTYWITPELKVAMALILLIGALLFRPQGLLGLRERVG